MCPVGGLLRHDLAARDISGTGPVKPGQSVACAIKPAVTGAVGAPPAGAPASGAVKGMVHAITRAGLPAPPVGQAGWLLIQRPGASSSLRMRSGPAR